MPQKKGSKKIKVRDLKPRKDAKGGFPQGPPNMPQGPPNRPTPNPSGPGW